MSVFPLQVSAIPGSTPAKSSALISAIPTKTEALIKKLEFDVSLTTQDQGTGIHIYYQHYKAVLAAILKYESLCKAGNWDGLFTPTHIDFVQLVTSKSMWYKQYKLFDQVSRYPQIIEWLGESEDRLTDIELWEFEHDIYQWTHFEGFLKRGGKPLKDSESESDSEKVQIKKKTHKKKDKAKAKAKAVSSSEGESELESAQKSQKKKVASGSGTHKR